MVQPAAKSGRRSFGPASLPAKFDHLVHAACTRRKLGAAMLSRRFETTFP